MKRLLAIILALTFIIMAFASCTKVVEDETDSNSLADSENGSGDIAPENGTSDSENGNTATDANGKETASNSDTEQTKPVFNGKESTSGLKFELNEDKQSYTVVGKGTSTATSIVIDGHNGLPVTRVGYSAFAEDNTITSVKLGDYVEVIEDQGFSMCKGITSLTFGKNVKFLGDYSFRYCNALTSVELGKNIEVIKYGAFYNCKNLATIKMYDKVRVIEEYAFDKTAYFNDSNNWKNNVLYIGTNLVKAKSDISGTYTVTAGTTCIGGLAFNGCKSLSGISIPDSVHSIGLKAFQNATALKNITIGNGVTYIGENAFKKTGLYNTSSSWKNNVLYVGSYLVAAKADLNGSYTVTAGTRVISDYAFEACERVSTIVIPDSVVYIGECAFIDCTKLSSVTIGSGVKEIGVYAFKDCTALKGIVLRKNDGWKADGIAISADKVASKEDALITLGILYSDKVWKRA